MLNTAPSLSLSGSHASVYSLNLLWPGRWGYLSPSNSKYNLFYYFFSIILGFAYLALKKALTPRHRRGAGYATKIKNQKPQWIHLRIMSKRASKKTIRRNIRLTFRSSVGKTENHISAQNSVSPMKIFWLRVRIRRPGEREKRTRFWKASRKCSTTDDLKKNSYPPS